MDQEGKALGMFKIDFFRSLTYSRFVFLLASVRPNTASPPHAGIVPATVIDNLPARFRNNPGKYGLNFLSPPHRD